MAYTHVPLPRVAPPSAKYCHTLPHTTYALLVRVHLLSLRELAALPRLVARAATETDTRVCRGRRKTSPRALLCCSRAVNLSCTTCWLVFFLLLTVYQTLPAMPVWEPWLSGCL